MERLRGADVIAEILVRQGVEFIAGLPGHTVLDLVDALHARKDRIEAVMVRNEETAGYLADAYFRLRHKPMAVYAHNSVGAANLLTGVMNARLDSSAMIVITGNVWSRGHGKGAFQELIGDRDAGASDIFRGSVKRAWQVNDATKLPEIMIKAYKEAVTGRPGPVLIDVTQEALAQRIEVDLPDDLGAYAPSGRIRGDEDAIEQALELLATAERPAILAGGGVQRAAASAELLAFAELTGIPVATTATGKGAIAEDHPLALGVTGWVGTLPATTAMRECDVLLAIGTRFSETDTGGWRPGAVFNIPPTRLIHVDIDPAEIGRNYPVATGIVGDAASVLRDLRRGAESRPSAVDRSAWAARLDEVTQTWAGEVEASVDAQAVPISSGWVTQQLRAAMPRDGVIITDVGNSQKWVLQQFPVLEAGTCISSLGGGSMGFGPCGGLGAALAMPDRKVAVITGDGSMSMSLHILPNVAELALPIVYVVYNDYFYGSVKRPQDMRFGPGHNHFTVFEHRSGQPYHLDFAAVANACGVPAERVTDPADLADAFKRAMAAEGPYLLDIEIEWDDYPPMSGSGGFPLPEVQ